MVDSSSPMATLLRFVHAVTVTISPVATSISPRPALSEFALGGMDGCCSRTYVRCCELTLFDMAVSIETSRRLDFVFRAAKRGGLGS
jgi:hypothetical protein